MNKPNKPNNEKTMIDLQSSVLIITDTKASDLSIGARVTSNLKQIFPFTFNSFETIIIDTDLFDFSELQTLLNNIETQSPHTQKIISASSLNSKQLLHLINQFKIFKILQSWKVSELEILIIESREEFYRLQQNEELVDLHREQNSKLQSLKKTLQERITTRQISLEQAKQRALESSKQLNILLKTIIQVQVAESLEDIERNITQVLSYFIRQTRIIFNSKALTQTKLYKDQYIFKLELELEPNLSGHILYDRQEGKFTLPEKKLLRQISEAVTLTINKILIRQKTENLKKQWESTFHSIVYPIAIIDDDFNVLQFNKKVLDVDKEKKKCFQILFNRKKPCRNCQMKQNKQGGHFQISQSQKHIEVLSRKFSNTPLSYVNIYKDITEEIFLEKQILVKAQASELGLIGSSIAHELNNPLSGVITLLQIVLEQLPSKSQYKNDILQMQEAAENCRKIIQNLLNFSRMAPVVQNISINIKDLTQELIHLTELKTKSRGVHISMISQGENHQLYLQPEVIKQVLTKFLNAIAETAIKDAEMKMHVSLKTKVTRHKDHQILILLVQEATVYQIIASVFLNKKASILSNTDQHAISRLIASLNGELILIPYNGEKAQAKLVIPFTKEPKSPK